MRIGEVEAITLPDGGTAIISNIPSNITIAFDVAEDGTVSHTQELLTTETGNIVKGNVQNFSHIEWLNRLDASLSRVHQKFSC